MLFSYLLSMYKLSGLIRYKIWLTSVCLTQSAIPHEQVDIEGEYLGEKVFTIDPIFLGAPFELLGEMPMDMEAYISRMEEMTRKTLPTLKSHLISQGREYPKDTRVFYSLGFEVEGSATSTGEAPIFIAHMMDTQMKYAMCLRGVLI